MTSKKNTLGSEVESKIIIDKQKKLKLKKNITLND